MRSKILDFADPDYAIATIKLARIIGDVMMTVYNGIRRGPLFEVSERFLGISRNGSSTCQSLSDCHQGTHQLIYQDVWFI